jgi:hypothetical protein
MLQENKKLLKLGNFTWLIWRMSKKQAKRVQNMILILFGDLWWGIEVAQLQKFSGFMNF